MNPIPTRINKLAWKQFPRNLKIDVNLMGETHQKYFNKSFCTLRNLLKCFWRV